MFLNDPRMIADILKSIDVKNFFIIIGHSNNSRQLKNDYIEYNELLQVI